MSVKVFDLASDANGAANRYRDTIEDRGYSDTIAAANALLLAVDRLTAAIADAQAD